MDIYAKNGDKVIVTKETINNGTEKDKEKAKRLLEIDKEYTVEKTIVRGWSTIVYLKEFPNEQFNSVSFIDAVK